MLKHVLQPCERAIIRKDLHNIWHTRMIRLTVILVPALLCLVLPAFYLAIAWFLPAEAGSVSDDLAFLQSAAGEEMTERQLMVYLVAQLLGPMFFLMIPLMVSTTSAACSFVGERENSTMETLLLAPVSLRQIFRAKVAACALLSLIAEAVSLLAFSLVMAIGSVLFETPFYFNLSWAVLVFLLAPAVALFGVTFMVLISGRSKSSMEAMQTSGYLVLPVVLLFVAQLSGAFTLGPVLLLLIAVLVGGADAVLVSIASRSFTPERLLRV